MSQPAFPPFRMDEEAADALFAEALRRADDLGEPLLRAFAHQHAGRNHVDQGRYAEALDSFRVALAIREVHDAPADQLESTRGALRATRRRAAGAT